VVEEGGYPPSAYDLIVMCNFLTNTSFTARFKSEIAGLARSLTPGGVLLVLGGTGGQYPVIYEALDRVVASAHLVRVLDEDLRAQCEPKARRIAAGQIISCLRYLNERAPEAYGTVRDGLHKDVHALDPEKLDFPRFHVRAYKREGHFAFNAREKRRMARRRSRSREPGTRY
jgi:hypothetical protein